MKMMFMLIFFLGCFQFAGNGTLAQLSVKSSEQKKNDRQIETPTDLVNMLSSSKTAQSEGYSIAALQRVKHAYRDILNHVVTDKIVMNVVIELHTPSRMEIISSRNAALCAYFLIGDKAYNRLSACPSDEEHCLNLVLEPEEFEQLKDNSTLSVMTTGAPLNSEMIKTMYENGKPIETVLFLAKFGRLNKKMISQFPIAEMPIVRVD